MGSANFQAANIEKSTSQEDPKQALQFAMANDNTAAGNEELVQAVETRLIVRQELPIVRVSSFSQTCSHHGILHHFTSVIYLFIYFFL